MTVNKLNKNEIVIFSICIFVIVFGLVLLNTNIKLNFFSSNDQNNDEQFLGKISKIKSDVRFKGTKSLFWESADRSENIYSGDSYFVGADSSLLIEFENKTILVGPNSLIKFKRENQQTKLNLQFGLIKSDNAPSEILIDDCGKMTSIESKNSELEITKSNNCGEIQVKSKNKSLKINKKAVAKTETLKIKLVEPLKLFAPPVMAAVSAPVVIKEPPKLPIPLPPQIVNLKIKNQLKTSKPIINWKKAEHASEYLLEISDSASFANPKIINSTNLDYRLENIIADKMFFRLKSVNADRKLSENYSEVGTIDIIYPDIVPDDSKIVKNYIVTKSDSKNAPEKVAVRWNKVPTAAKYVLEVDQDANFTKPQRFISRKPSGILELPVDKNYKFRIAAYTSDNRKISSTKSVGEIVYNKMFSLAAPIIEKEFQNMHIYFQKGLGKNIWLRWAESPSAKRYRIEFSRDQNFSAPVSFQPKEKKRFLLSSKLPSGNYFWRIRAESDEHISDWSVPGSIKINSGSDKNKIVTPAL